VLGSPGSLKEIGGRSCGGGARDENGQAV
jgi:hypothetical protein